MTVPTTSTPDYFRQAAHTGQDAVGTVIRAWGQTWQWFMGDRGRYPSRVANPDGLIAATCATPQTTKAAHTSSSRLAGQWG